MIYLYNYVLMQVCIAYFNPRVRHEMGNYEMYLYFEDTNGKIREG
jgi:hypothetical protein